MKNRITTGILFILLLAGCKTAHQVKLEPESFLHWYSSDKNPFRSTDTINDIYYSFASYPKEVSIAICALNKCESKEVLSTDLKAKSATLTYLLELVSLNPRKDLFESANSQMSKNDQIIYLNNGIKHDLKAITERGDTLKCVSVTYEPALAKKFRLLIDFESPGSASINHIIYNDRLMSQSLIAFDFSKTTHSNFPLLNLKNYEK